MKPNPGSDAALALGCTCPVLDNAHGRHDDGLFWIAADCPVHGVPYCLVCGHELEAVRPGKWQCNWCEGGFQSPSGDSIDCHEGGRFERLAQAERMMQV